MTRVKDTEVNRGHKGEARLLRRAVLCVLCILCVLCANPLNAQPGGFAMPDPKEMSGIPRPVDDLPNGTVSVRLIRGSLSNNLTGHAVELHVEGGNVRKPSRRDTAG